MSFARLAYGSLPADGQITKQALKAKVQPAAAVCVQEETLGLALGRKSRFMADSVKDMVSVLIKKG